jgi:hypothetical protein
MAEKVTIEDIFKVDELKPSFVNENAFREKEARWDNTPLKRIKRSLNTLNSKLIESPKYFPESRTQEDLEVIKHNITTHLLFHTITQNGIGNIQSMETLITHDLHFVKLLGGLEENQKRKLAIAADMKINNLVRGLINSPRNRVEDFGPNILGDYLLYLELLDFQKTPDQLNNIRLTIGDNPNFKDKSFVERTMSRLEQYNNGNVMTQFLDGFSEQDRNLIEENRTKIIEAQKLAIQNSISFLETF